MARGCSLIATQWLFYVQETCDDLLNRDGSRAILHHMYYRGEHQLEGYTIDGYAMVDGRHVFYEFLGDYYHPEGADQRWERKSRLLQSLGTLHVMREGVWRKQVQVKGLKHFHTSSFPLIMNTFGKEKELLSAIQNDNIYGFAVCDVTTPSSVYEKIKHINFPPVIRRAIIDEELLSPYMKQRCQERGYKLPQKTLIQSYNGTQLLLMTPMIQFYLSLGLVISNISKFVQYRPAIAFDKFVKKITNGRITAKRNNNESLELAFKIIGNG